MRRIIACILFAFSLCSSAWATNRYVSKTDGATWDVGNDSYDGTSPVWVSGTIGPWLTLDKGCTSVSPGDTLFVCPGNYNEKLYVRVNGTTAAWITYKAWIAGTVTLDGTGLSFASQNAMIYLSQKHCTIVDGFTVTGVASGTGYGALALGSTTPGSFIYGLEFNNLKVERCSSMLAGIAIVGQYGYLSATVQNCEADTLTTNAMEAYRFDGKTWLSKIINCIARHVTNIGFVFNGKPTGSELQPTKCLMANNYVTRAGGSDTGNAFYFDGAKDCVMQDNIAEDTHGGVAIACETAGVSCTGNVVRRMVIKKTWHYGIILGSAADKGDIRNNWIYNNTSIDNDNIGLLLGFYKDGSTNRLINTLMATTVGPNYMNYSYPGNTVTAAAYGMDWNLYYSTETMIFQIKEVNYSGFANWLLQAGGNDTLGSISADPLVNADGTLRSGSPAIDAGNTLTVTTDAGTGTTFSVSAAGWFCDGFGGLMPADTIRVGSDTVTIASIDKISNSITATATFTWESGEGVALPYYGAKPDIGYAETVPTDTPAANVPAVRRTGKGWKNLLPWKW